MSTEPESASPAGTQAYFEKHPLPVAPVRLGRTGWSVAPVGFGSYRIRDREPVHRAALREALLSGCNLIDTSANYGDGAAELLIGQVLADLVGGGLLRRQELVIVTKAGCLQGENLELARARARDGHPFPEVVELQPHLWHCISPEFLEDQITRSLKRLGLARLDVLLLHNPEYFLAGGGGQSEYYRRIQAAFMHLEAEAARGRIQYYGVSSDTSLEAVLDCAGPRFAVIQFPFNLLEAGAVLEKNNGGKSLVELARERDLGTLVNRPLNALNGKRLLRLADFPVHDPELTRQRIQNGIAELTRLETTHPAGTPPEELRWGHFLRRNFNQLEELETWNNFLAHRIRPSLAFSVHDETTGENAEQEWNRTYLAKAGPLFEAITHQLQNHAAVDADRVSRTLVEAVPALGTDSATLSSKVFRIYRSFPGIHCILSGMRRPEYVRDALTLPPPLSEEEALRALESTELLR